MTDPAAVTPASGDAGTEKDVDALVEKIRVALPGPHSAHVALSDIAARARRVAELEAALRDLREAIAEALTSLATGPAKDGYAYALLDAALAGDGGGA